ncbi:MAG: hypothetical protein IPO27_09640 [Bacteroidetes bacterium]|nr:hypothetical protein [Bacteroidota bacterium]
MVEISGSGSLSKIIVDGLQINSGSSGLLNNIAMNQMQNGASITDPSQVAFTLSSLQTLNPDKKGEKLTLSTWGSIYSLQQAEWKFSDAAMGASGKQTATFPNGKVYTVGSPVEVEGNEATAQSGGGSSWLDNLQTGLDVAGIADSTGIVDLGNALIYAGRGQWGKCRN